MRIVGLDSSGLVASVAVLSDGVLTAEYTVNYKKTHSQTLLPMLDEIVRMCELDLAEIDGIAVAAGPGSFTGLRIGSATAKGLAFALEKPIIPVPTTAGLAYNLFGAAGLICPIMDARRDQVYNGLYRFRGEELVTVCGQRALGVDELLRELEAGQEPVVFLGDGVAAYRSRIEAAMKRPCLFAPPHLSVQRAGSVAALGTVLFKTGLCESGAEHEPIYLRAPQAERERAEKEKKAAGQSVSEG